MTYMRLPLCRKGTRVTLGLGPPGGGSVSRRSSRPCQVPGCREAGHQEQWEACPGAQDRGSPGSPVPNCSVYEALPRASSGFPNELVCCLLTAVLVIASETGGRVCGPSEQMPSPQLGFCPHPPPSLVVNTWWAEVPGTPPPPPSRSTRNMFVTPFVRTCSAVIMQVTAQLPGDMG